MSSHAFLISFTLACVWQNCQLKADNYNSGVIFECTIEIPSMGHANIDQDRFKIFNETVQVCQLDLVFVNYERISSNEKSGESLVDLNQLIFPILAPVPHLKELYVYLLGGRGLSVDLKIPSFSAQTKISFLANLFDFRLLYNNGTEVRESSVGQLDTSPFSNQHPIYVALFRGTRYHLNTCPLIFNSAFISFLHVLELAASTVKYNMLGFESTKRALNCTVNRLRLNGYGLKFDSVVFPIAVFEKTKIVFLGGMIDSFEAVTLRESVIEVIVLAVSRLRRFFHNNPNWLNEVNSRGTNRPFIVEIEEAEKVRSNFEGEDQKGYIAWIETKDVDALDDSSFCIFNQIEQYSLNVLFFGKLIESRANESCSCLLFWIVTKYHLQIRGKTVTCTNADQLSGQCDFNNMSRRCSIETIEPLNYRTIYDVILDLEYFKYLADVWLVPATSLLGIIANYLVIRTFSRIKRSPEYRRNKLTDKSRYMWEYTYYNSWFLLLHGLVLACTPLGSCIEPNGVYCSAFISSSLFRPFYLFVETFLGNTFRLAANMSNTLSVLYRFGLNTDKLARFRQLRPKIPLACLCILSLSVSVITLFANEKFPLQKLSKNPLSYLIEIEFPVLKANLILKSLYLLNTFLVTILFTLLNMFIDLCLLSLLRSLSTQRPKEEAEKRITKMVILNGLFSFCFRLPEMASAILLIIFTFDRQTIPVCIIANSHYHSLCPILFSISHFLLTISYLENLVLLYFFNHTFRRYFESSFRIKLFV
nr:G protein-coupled receptor [Proales similis]